MTKATLIKVQSTHNNLRTDEIEGRFADPPTLGHSFGFFADPLDETMDIRVVTTSRVQSVQQTEEGFIFSTLNSTYYLKLAENISLI